MQSALEAEQREADTGRSEQVGRSREIKAELVLVRQLEKAEREREKGLYKRMLKQHA